MSNNPFIAIALGCLIGGGIVVSHNSISYNVAQLRAAAQEQCRNHDWPEHQHQAHIDWCVQEGYLLNTAN